MCYAICIFQICIWDSTHRLESHQSNENYAVYMLKMFWLLYYSKCGGVNSNSASLTHTLNLIYSDTARAGWAFFSR